MPWSNRFDDPVPIDGGQLDTLRAARVIKPNFFRLISAPEAKVSVLDRRVDGGIGDDVNLGVV